MGYFRIVNDCLEDTLLSITGIITTDFSLTYRIVKVTEPQPGSLHTRCSALYFIIWTRHDSELLEVLRGS